jgi:SAM-dependent methyltransferase
MPNTNYKKITEYCESQFDLHGDSYRGVGWTSLEATIARYKVMLELIRTGETVDLLDFGCGTAGLLDYLAQTATHRHIRYTGIDISEKYIAVCRNKYPHTTFLLADVFEQPIPIFDYIVMNGVFTAKTTAISYPAMWEYALKLIRTLFGFTRQGLAFNVMSKAVDWERDYLFHVPVGDITDFVTTLTRRYVIRHDYGCYEYTVYMYK